MINKAEIPHTEQGLINYIRFGEMELKRSAKKNKSLAEMMGECRTRLTMLGWYFVNNQWTKEKYDALCQTPAN